MPANTVLFVEEGIICLPPAQMFYHVEVVANPAKKFAITVRLTGKDGNIFPKNGLLNIGVDIYVI